MKWISVDSELPSATEWVLVYSDGAMRTLAYVPGRGFEDWDDAVHSCLIIGDITHWAHLPNVPSTSEENKMESDCKIHVEITLGNKIYGYDHFLTKPELEKCKFDSIWDLAWPEIGNKLREKINSDHKEQTNGIR